jgi:PAS domain S-box-containing protein
MTPMRARRILSALFVASALPFLLVVSFPAPLDLVMDIGAYLVFHNVAEFFSIMVSLSVFGVGWYAYDQSKDRHALFLGTAFLAVGLIDFMHALGNAAMPAFITANSTNKSTQYWIAARLLDASALLASAFIYPDRPVRGLTKRNLLTAALVACALVFTGVTFFPSHLPATFIKGVGLTAFKVGSECLVISLLLLALGAYWQRMKRTGDGLLIYYMAAFVIAIVGEAAFASYKTGFDSYNVLGHVYKVVAFYLIYRAAFAASVRKPYLQLSEANDKLRIEIAERQEAGRKVRALNAELEQRVSERTSRLERANVEMEESREWLRVTLSSIGDAVLACNTARRVTFMNPVAGALTGWSPAEAFGQPIEDVFVTIDERSRAPGQDIVGQVLKEARASALANHTALRTRDRREIPIEDTAAPIMDRDGAVSGVVLVFHDVTEKRRAEEALRDASRRKDEFLGMLSHELRNPLAPIRNSVYILERAEPASEQASRARSVIKRQTEHLTRLVDDLLDVTRIARGRIELRRSRVDLGDVVLRAADDFRVMMEERGVAFRTVIPESEVWSEADATRITQVLGNLLHNAAKFTSAGNEVTLSLRAAGAEAEIRVRDTGAGIDPALLPHVFDAFVQGERTLARAEGGLGLGLALVRGITELHGGSVRAESGGIGKGADFAVCLPLVRAALAGDPEPPREARASRARRVLVVDDNVDAAQSLAELVKMLGHAADVAYDGPSAVERARANPPDVLLCDVGLPGMSGYDVAKALRGGADGIQLFAVSGYAQPEDVKKALEAGFDGHVAKPCDPREIKRLLA